MVVLSVFVQVKRKDIIKILIKGTLFINKYSDGKVGAIYIREVTKNNITIWIICITFTNNCSPSTGGAIYGDGGTLKVINADFFMNEGERGGNLIKET